MVQHEYWKTASEGLSPSDYPEVNEEDVVFPSEIPIAYAVCPPDCGAAQFIVDGSSQICEYCGRQRFRTAVRWYVLRPEDSRAPET
jgi:hypothetical protein